MPSPKADTLILPWPITLNSKQNTQDAGKIFCILYWIKFHLLFTITPLTEDPETLQALIAGWSCLIRFGCSLSHRSINCSANCVCSALILVKREKCKGERMKPIIQLFILTNLIKYQIKIIKQNSTSCKPVIWGCSD